MTQPANSGDDALLATLPGRVFLRAEQTPTRCALRNKDRGIWQEVTWLGYRDAMGIVARGLQDLGVGEGDHVSILSDNRPEWLFADLGIQALGARAVGVYQTNPAEDVAYVLSHSQSRVLFCEDQEQVDKAIEVVDETPMLEHIIVFDPRGIRDYEDNRIMNWETFMARGTSLYDPAWLESLLRARDPKEATMVVYTSGTTGNPKGALLSSANVVDVAQAMGPTLSLGPSDTVLSYLPLCHVAEKIFTVFLPLTSGAVVHFGESIATVQADLKEVSPTLFLGVPRIWEKMHASVTLKMKDSTRLKRGLYDYWTLRGQEIASRRRAGTMSLWDRFRWFLADQLVFRALQERLGMRNCKHPVSGAAPISADLLRWFHGIGIPILEGFGQTESSGVSHLNRPNAVKIGTVGTPLPLVEQKLDDDGEVLVRGPMVFSGYLHQPEATAEAIDDAGWLRTGDIGKIDAEGFLSITGRKKEIIITAGGKNLSPEKIENAIKMSPYVKEIVAIGDRRKFVSALIQIDYDAVGDWATRLAIPYTSFGDLTAKPEVEKLISAEVQRLNEKLVRVESVRSFRLLSKELHQDDGEMTATQKVKRGAVLKIYEGLIESMY